MNQITRSILLTTILCVWSATATAEVFYDTYERGLAAFKAKDYANARSEFLRAYDLRSEPIILFNVGQTYRLEHNSEQALIYYKRFLSEPKIAEDLRREAQDYVAKLEAEQKARDEEREREASPDPRERAGIPVRVATPPEEIRRVSSSSASRDTANSSAKTSSTVVPITVGAGAVALLGAGLGFERWAESRYTAAKSETTSQSRRDSLYDSANTKRHVAAALAVSGLVASGAAVWLYLRDRKSERDAASHATMHVVPTFAGLALLGQF